jgi:hypothetical protein
MAKAKKKAGARKGEPKLIFGAANQREFSDSLKKSHDLFNVVKGAGGRSVISIGRLEAIEASVRRGDALDTRAQTHIVQLIDYVIGMHAVESGQRAGRPTNSTIQLCAAIVRELHVNHGIKVQAAVSAMVREDFGTEDSRNKARQNVERAYRKLSASKKKYPVNERLVREALERINPPKTGNNS